MNIFAEADLTSSRQRCFALLRCTTVLALHIEGSKIMMPKAKDSGASIGCSLEIKLIRTSIVFIN